MSNLAEKPSPLSSSGVRIIKPHEFDSNTPQTPGMLRLAAVPVSWLDQKGCGVESRL